MIDQDPYFEFKSTDGLKYRLYNNCFEVYCGEEVGWINICNENEKGSEEKKMSNFKVGDIVKVKSIEEMKKSDIYGELLDCFENTIHKISCVGNLGYSLEGCGGVIFDNTMLEYYGHTENDIFAINIIVPDKVVEVEFYDGKEKMICHEDDIFDLRKCCFIAIAKHLYKKEYTQEGIEYMAKQLTYQKKYVKIVDKALKDYKRKRRRESRKDSQRRGRKDYSCPPESQETQTERASSTET